MEKIADLGGYFESQVTSILADLARDEGKNLQQAEDYISQSISIRSRFDQHLEAQALLIRAGIQRLQGNGEYLTGTTIVRSYRRRSVGSRHCGCFVYCFAALLDLSLMVAPHLDCQDRA